MNADGKSSLHVFAATARKIAVIVLTSTFVRNIIKFFVTAYDGSQHLEDPWLHVKYPEHAELMVFPESGEGPPLYRKGDRFGFFKDSYYKSLKYLRSKKNETKNMSLLKSLI